jgi:hypothetical protein
MIYKFLKMIFLVLIFKMFLEQLENHFDKQKLF